MDTLPEEFYENVLANLCSSSIRKCGKLPGRVGRVAQRTLHKVRSVLWYFRLGIQEPDDIFIEVCGFNHRGVEVPMTLDQCLAQTKFIRRLKIVIHYHYYDDSEIQDEISRERLDQIMQLTKVVPNVEISVSDKEHMEHNRKFPFMDFDCDKFSFGECYLEGELLEAMKYHVEHTDNMKKLCMYKAMGEWRDIQKLMFTFLKRKEAGILEFVDQLDDPGAPDAHGINLLVHRWRHTEMRFPEKVVMFKERCYDFLHMARPYRGLIADVMDLSPDHSWRYTPEQVFVIDHEVHADRKLYLFFKNIDGSRDNDDWWRATDIYKLANLFKGYLFFPK